jgi:hypothetical protein
VVKSVALAIGLPEGILDVPSENAKVTRVASEAMTQFRSTVKKEVSCRRPTCTLGQIALTLSQIKDSISDPKQLNIIQLTERLAKRADVKPTVPLCARVALLVSLLVLDCISDLTIYLTAIYLLRRGRQKCRI